MKSQVKYPDQVFISLQELLKMEYVARRFSLLSRKQRVKTILGGKHASKLRGRGIDFEEVRNYVPGDDIRNIDWKVTARTQKTQSKVFTEEKEKPALIVVDQSYSMFFGSKMQTKSVVAAKAAALAAFRVLKEGDRVGGVVLGEHDMDIVFPKRNRKNILRFLDKIVLKNRALAHFETKEKLSVKEILQRVNNLVSHDFLIIIISDFQEYNPLVLKQITKLSKHNDVVAIKVFDPLERDIPKEKIIVGDRAKQVLVAGDTKKIQSKFKTGFDTDVLSFESSLLKHRIPLLKVSTIEEIDTQLQTIIKKRN